MRAYFHGCTGDGSGHGFHGTHERWTGNRTPREVVPFKSLDGGLAPKLASQTQGVAQLHHKDGWTALAFWDRSGDSRGNSNSVFIFEGTWTFDQVLVLAKEHFPESFARFDFEIRPIMRYITRDEAVAAAERLWPASRDAIDAYENAIRSTVPADAIVH